MLLNLIYFPSLPIYINIGSQHSTNKLEFDAQFQKCILYAFHKAFSSPLNYYCGNNDQSFGKCAELVDGCGYTNILLEDNTILILIG